MHSDEIKSLVRNAYGAIDSDTSALAAQLYSSDQLARVPRASAGRALGVGNHLLEAEIRPGEVILDIGCG